MFAEHAYLTTALAKQAVVRQSLIRDYSDYERQLANSGNMTGKARRRLRKKMNLTQDRLDLGAQQERSIYLRLGELFMEQQSHETWTHAQQRHAMPFAQPFPDQPQLGLITNLNDVYYSAPNQVNFIPDYEWCPAPQNTPLNPTLPGFVPGQYSFGSGESSQLQHTSWSSSSFALETVSETSEDVDPLCVTANLSKIVIADGGDEAASWRRSTSDDDECGATRERRLSLPCLQSPWPED